MAGGATIGPMNDSMAHPGESFAHLGLPYWKTVASWIAATAIAALFLSSGIWKISDPQGWAVRLTQARVPASLSVAGALFFGIAETVAGGADSGAETAPLGRDSELAAAGFVPDLLRGQLRGAARDRLQLLSMAEASGGAGLLHWRWRDARTGGIRGAVGGTPGESTHRVADSRRGHGVRVRVVRCGRGVRQTGVRAPATVMVDGRPYSLEHGKFFLFFFHPGCSHCTSAAKQMSQLDWGDTKVVAIPVEQRQFAQGFLDETGLHGGGHHRVRNPQNAVRIHCVPLRRADRKRRRKDASHQLRGRRTYPRLKRLGFVH